ncbi:hypothetical protein ACN47E_010049 [Coniothyrium glycines]
MSGIFKRQDRLFHELPKKQMQFDKPTPAGHHDLLDAAAKVGHIEAKIGYRFKDKSLGIEALKLTSQVMPLHYKGVTETMVRHNRLALMGDRVLSLAVCEMWYGTGNTLEDYSNTLTRVASRAALNAKGRELGFDKHLLLDGGRSELGPSKDDVAEAFEAILGAVYVDSGQSLEAVKNVLRGIRLTEDSPSTPSENNSTLPSNVSQENLQSQGERPVQRRLLDGLKDVVGRSTSAAEVLDTVPHHTERSSAVTEVDREIEIRHLPASKLNEPAHDRGARDALITRDVEPQITPKHDAVSPGSKIATDSPPQAAAVASTATRSKKQNSTGRKVRKLHPWQYTPPPLPTPFLAELTLRFLHRARTLAQEYALKTISQVRQEYLEGLRSCRRAQVSMINELEFNARKLDSKFPLSHIMPSALNYTPPPHALHLQSYTTEDLQAAKLSATRSKSDLRWTVANVRLEYSRRMILRRDQMIEELSKCSEEARILERNMARRNEGRNVAVAADGDSTQAPTEHESKSRIVHAQQAQRPQTAEPDKMRMHIPNYGGDEKESGPSNQTNQTLYDTQAAPISDGVPELRSDIDAQANVDSLHAVRTDAIDQASTTKVAESEVEAPVAQITGDDIADQRQSERTSERLSQPAEQTSGLNSKQPPVVRPTPRPGAMYHVKKNGCAKATPRNIVRKTPYTPELPLFGRKSRPIVRKYKEKMAHHMAKSNGLSWLPRKEYVKHKTRVEKKHRVERR